MAVKSTVWFLGQALAMERRRTRLAHLSGRVLDLGLLGKDSARSHVIQSVGATQKFLAAYPAHRATIRRASPIDPYKPTGAVLADWLTFLAARNGSYERKAFLYDYGKLRRVLTAKYGGTRTGGGGGDNEFEIVLRLMASFV